MKPQGDGPWWRRAHQTILRPTAALQPSCALKQCILAWHALLSGIEAL